LRELHGGYSRRIHAIYGQTREGHLFRHAFFARRLGDTEEALDACAYVDINPTRHRVSPAPRRTDWAGLAATLGRTHPRSFHSPGALLELVDPRPATARRLYQQRVRERHAAERLDPSPNDVLEASRG
jgi:hypothetical protein